VQIVLRACGEHERNGPRVSDLHRGGDAFGRELDVVDGILLPPGEILYRAACQADLDAQPDGLRDVGRIIGEAVLQVGRDGQVRRGDNHRGVY